MTRWSGRALLVRGIGTASLFSALLIPASTSAQSLGAATASIREGIDDVTTVLATDVDDGSQVAVAAGSSVGIDGFASSEAFANSADVTFPIPQPLSGTNVTFGGIDMGASTMVDGNTTTPPTPNVFVSTSAEVFWGQQCRLAGGTGSESILVDVILDVSGTLDVGGAGSFTNIVASIDFGSVYEEPGVGPIFNAAFSNIVCQAGGGIGDCFFFSDAIDESQLTVLDGFDTVTVFGQIVISGFSELSFDTAFMVGPRLTLTIEDDLSTSLGPDPAIADFSDSIRFALSPQDPTISVTCVPEPATRPLAVASLLALGCMRRLRNNRIDRIRRFVL